MKPSTLIKIFVSGMMASAFLLTTACDNASKRSIKALYDPKANSQQNITDANTECTKDIASAIEERAKAIAPINASLTAAAQKPLTQPEKDALQVLIQALKPKTDAVIKEINSTRVDGKTITGCFIKEAGASKKTRYSIQSFKVEDVLLAKRVKAVTEKTNDIVDLAAQDKDLIAQTTLSQHQIYQITNELAHQLGPENKDGHMYILDGYVALGADTQDELTALIQEKKKSVCSLLSSTEKPKDDVRLEVVSISEKASEDRKSAESEIVMSGGKDLIFNFKCSLASSNDIPTQVRSVFGDLISLDVSFSTNSANSED